MDYLSALHDAVLERKIVLLACPPMDYATLLMNITAAVSSASDRVCFVTFLKPHRNRIAEFVEYNRYNPRGIDLKKFFFVDGVERVAEFPTNDSRMKYLLHPIRAIEDLANSTIRDHLYLHSITDIDHINKRILSVVWDKRSNALLFDALFMLQEYMSEDDIIRLMHAMTARLRAFKCALVIPFLVAGQDIELMKRLQPLADKTIIAKK